MKRTDYDEFTLSTGRTVYANRGLIGLGINDGEFEISEGYDGHIWVDDTWDGNKSKWTVSEKGELADFMIGLWTAFKLASQ